MTQNPATPSDKRDATALLPCPFCGGDSTRTIFIRDGRKAVCPCGASSRPEFHGPLDMPSADARAISSWNTRAVNTLPAHEECVEALRDLAIAMEAVLAAPDDATRRPHAKHFMDRARKALASVAAAGEVS